MLVAVKPAMKQCVQICIVYYAQWWVQ